MNVRRTCLTARLKPRLAALRWGGRLGAGLLALAFGNVALGGAAGGVEVAGRKAGVEC